MDAFEQRDPIWIIRLKASLASKELSWMLYCKVSSLFATFYILFYT